MTKIIKDKLVTETQYLNLFSRTFERNGEQAEWLYCSRQKEPDNHNTKNSDAVVVCAVHKDTNQLIVTSEYRVPIMEREWGMPAGLIDAGETPQLAAIREFYEETGMKFEPRSVSPPNLYSSVGMTNESVTIVFGYAEGLPTNENNELLEDIEIHLMNKQQVSDFLDECQDGVRAIGAKGWFVMTMFKNDGLKYLL
jgi:ADP-ribose pyrophosphatase